MRCEPQVWIEKRPGKRAKMRYYVRWIDGATHKVRCKAVGTDAGRAVFAHQPQEGECYGVLDPDSR